MDAATAPWVVFAADVPLAPLVHGNRVRVAQMVEAVRRAGFRVAYLYWERDPREGDVRDMRGMVDELVVVRRGLAKLGKRILRARRGLAHALSKAGWIDEVTWWRLVENRDRGELCPAELGLRLAEILASREVAAFVAVYANLAPLADVARARGVFSAVDTQDVMHERAETLRAQGVKPAGLIVSRATEGEWIARFDLVIAIQEREARALSGLVDPRRVLTIEHGVRLPASVEERLVLEHDLVLIGSNNRPNQHGLAWFVDEVWPRVLREVGDARLLVFGPLAGTSACAGPRVEAVGRVDEVRTAYDRARLVVNPVRAGSGLKIKTVEALAFAKPLVTTRVGADGLEDASGTAFLASDDPTEFAAHCVRILTDDEFAHGLARAGREFARARFAPEQVYAPLVEALRSALARRGLSAP